MVHPKEKEKTSDRKSAQADGKIKPVFRHDTKIPITAEMLGLTEAMPADESVIAEPPTPDHSPLRPNKFLEFADKVDRNLNAERKKGQPGWAK